MGLGGHGRERRCRASPAALPGRGSQTAGAGSTGCRHQHNGRGSRRGPGCAALGTETPVAARPGVCLLRPAGTGAPLNTVLPAVVPAELWCLCGFAGQLDLLTCGPTALPCQPLASCPPHHHPALSPGSTGMLPPALPSRAAGKWKQGRSDPARWWCAMVCRGGTGQEAAPARPLLPLPAHAAAAVRKGTAAATLCRMRGQHTGDTEDVLPRWPQPAPGLSLPQLLPPSSQPSAVADCPSPHTGGVSVLPKLPQLHRASGSPCRLLPSAGSAHSQLAPIPCVPLIALRRALGQPLSSSQVLDSSAGESKDGPAPISWGCTCSCFLQPSALLVSH